MVLLPTPPFWFAIAMMRARPGVSGTVGALFLAERFGFAGAGPLEAGEDAVRDALAEALVTVEP
ncbi:MAG TPA: hypothetical protein VFQ40_03965 [Actinomycetota bacterium]|nr:hypothetical protein [Actinomycetota bacterium]